MFGINFSRTSLRLGYIHVQGLSYHGTGVYQYLLDMMQKILIHLECCPSHTLAPGMMYANTFLPMAPLILAETCLSGTTILADKCVSLIADCVTFPAEKS